MENKKVIIPVRELAYWISNITTSYLQECNPNEQLPPHSFWKELTIKQIEDSLSRRMRWSIPTDNVLFYLRSYNLFTAEQEQHFICEQLDCLAVRIDEFLDYSVEYNTWMVWALEPVINHPNSDFAIKPVADFRILDWDRRMCSGTWKSEQRVSANAFTHLTKGMYEANVASLKFEF
ncbi:hypothetical protein [Endozoicomonas sp. ONNA1]|uniref:hypothetical protein n=1 Tax=Endozoicomonas sp. ONNA1 TaxID=2828740 RepID=UPI0021498AF3|nr:hypothetical protein [Endozoicomonas sp. ONNA1]